MRQPEKHEFNAATPAIVAITRSGTALIESRSKQMQTSTTPSRLRRQRGFSQTVAIVVLLVIGVALGAWILSMDKGRSVQAGDDDDGPRRGRPAASAANGKATDGKAADGKAMDDKADANDKADAKAGTPRAARIDLDDAQVKASAIAVEQAGPAHITAMVQFPGEIMLNDERTVHVVARVPGVAESVHVSTGQQVKKGQLLAILSSQQMSDQRSQLLAARKRLDFATAVHEREKKLFEQKITAEQDYLQATQALREAEIELENARQKLSAIGVGTQVTPGSSLNRFELRAAHDGLVVQRDLAVGEAVKEDTPVFTIADLSTVWAEVHIPAKDLPAVQVGSKLTVKATAFDAQTTGSVAFIGALVGEQTRMAKARIVLANPKGLWRPGLFVTVEARAGDAEVPVAVDHEAIQSLGTQPVVFVRDDKGFVARPVVTGRSDGRRIEITQGLQPGVRYAARGSYILKSELSKLASEEGY